MTMTYSACIEMLFKDESEDYADRIHRARAAGFAAVEFWRWRDKDLAAIGQALQTTGAALEAILVEPKAALTDRDQHAAFLQALEETVETAERLGARGVIAQVGQELPDIDREAQTEAILACLAEAVPLLADTRMCLMIEPLNTVLDHPGYFLSSTREGLDIVEQVGSPTVRLLYDIYHSAMMGEEPVAVLNGRTKLVGHVHFADAPGRGEPGSGSLDWRACLALLRRQGYAGRIGLEYRPTRTTSATLGFMRADS
jgi:hydroxypyruvate isomerase